MRILYLGLPLGALTLMAASHRPVGIGINHRPGPGQRRLRRRVGADVLFLRGPSLTDEAVVRLVASCHPDVLLCWFWPSRVPASLLALPRLGAFGVHPSLLPALRGPDPCYWAIRAGLTETGVTLHRLAADYDTGDVVWQTRVPIEPDDDAHRLAHRLDKPSLDLLVRCADHLASGRSLASSRQDDQLASYAPMPTDEDLRIDWRAPAAETVRGIRAAAPWPGAEALLGDHPVHVIDAAVYGGPVPNALTTCEAMRVDEGLAVVNGRGEAVLVRAARLAETDRVARGRALHELVSESAVQRP
jgi:methionyl-tRNA formyltransferase